MMSAGKEMESVRLIHATHSHHKQRSPVLWRYADAIVKPMTYIRNNILDRVVHFDVLIGWRAGGPVDAKKPIGTEKRRKNVKVLPLFFLLAEINSVLGKVLHTANRTI